MGKREAGRGRRGPGKRSTVPWMWRCGWQLVVTLAPVLLTAWLDHGAPGLR